MIYIYSVLNRPRQRQKRQEEKMRGFKADIVVITLIAFLAISTNLGAQSCGEANTDGEVNVSDAVRIINYVFAGGDPPYP